MPKNNKSRRKPIPEEKAQLEFTPHHGEELTHSLWERFERNMLRHQRLVWAEVQAKLELYPEGQSSLYAMESIGGEPDMIGFEPDNN